MFGLGKKAEKAGKTATKKVKSAGKTATKKVAAPVKKAAAPVKKAAQKVKKAAPSTKKVQSVARKAVSAKGGWLGGAGGAQDLDKWYGEHPAPPRMQLQHQVLSRAQGARCGAQ